MFSRAQEYKFHREGGNERCVWLLLDNSRGSLVRRSRPVGFYYLILSGVILGLFVCSIIIGLVLASNWVSEALHYDVLLGGLATLFVALGVAVFLVWLVREPLRRKKL